jgi:hypothetical protein
VTHTFYLGYINAPTEGVLVLCLAQVVLGLFPSTRPLVASKFVLVGYLLSGGLTMIYALFDAARAALSDAEKRRRAVVGLYPTAISVAITLRFVVSDPHIVANPFFTMGAGLILVYQAQIAIIGHLLLSGPASFFNAGVVLCWAAGIAGALVENVPGFPSYWHFYCVFVAVVILVWDVYVIKGFSDGLDIPVFTLPKKKS